MMAVVGRVNMMKHSVQKHGFDSSCPNLVAVFVQHVFGSNVLITTGTAFTYTAHRSSSAATLAQGPLGPRSRSEGSCLCRTSISGLMAADGGDCAVQIVSAFSDENLCVLDLPSSSTVLDIKRHVQTSHGISIFRQRLLVSPAGHQVEDHQVLAALPGLRP